MYNTDEIDLNLRNVTYGSFSAAGAQEAYVSYWTMAEGELSRGGGFLFKREKDKWKLVETKQSEAPLNDCVALPGNGRSRMLCYVHQMECCFGSDDSISLVTGAWDKGKDILYAHNGRRDDGPDSVEDFCKAGKENRTLLTSIHGFGRSNEPGVLAVAHVGYVTPVEIKEVCAINELSDVHYMSGRIRFVMDGDNVKAILPEGVKEFSTYGR